MHFTLFFSSLPSFADEYDKIASILNGSTQSVYDKPLIIGMLQKTAGMHDKPIFDFSQVNCVKSDYAEKFDHRRPADTFIGRLRNETGIPREFGLANAVSQQGIEHDGHYLHNASGKAQVTRLLISTINSPNFRYSGEHINRKNNIDNNTPARLISRIKNAIVNTPEGEANFNRNEGEISPTLLVHTDELAKTPSLDLPTQPSQSNPTSTIKKKLRDYYELTDVQLTHILADEIKTEFGISLTDDELKDLTFKIGANKGSAGDQVDAFVEDIKAKHDNTVQGNEVTPSPSLNENNIEYKTDNSTKFIKYPLNM